jgi:hypothetical protein
LFTLTATPAGWAAILSHIALTALFAIVGVALEETIRRLPFSDVTRRCLNVASGGVLLVMEPLVAESLLTFAEQVVSHIIF